MIDWNTYGSVIRIYKGSGSLYFGEDKERCDFELVQLANGGLYALCQVSDPVKALSLFNKEPEKLIGEIGDDHILTFSNNMIIKSVSEKQLIVYGKFVSVQSLKPYKSARFRFALVNLVMNEKRIQLSCDGLNLTIRRVENYDGIVFALKASKGIAVTCEIVIDSNSAIARETVVNTVNDVCLLLTLSQGCRVTWLYYDIVKPNDEIIESFHGSAITKPLTGLPLIADQDMAGFLEGVYSNLLGQKEFWQIQKAVDAYTDAKVEGDFLEARALKLVILMEHLKARYLSQKNKEFILNPPETFDDSMEGLINIVKHVLAYKFPDIEPEKLEMMANHVKGINHFPFNRALSEMCNYIGLQTNSRERQHFINIRNELVHRFRFYPDYGSAWQQFSYLMDFIGKILLTILKYEGYYYNWIKLCSGQSKMRVKLDIAENGGSA